MQDLTNSGIFVPPEIWEFCEKEKQQYYIDKQKEQEISQCITPVLNTIEGNQQHISLYFSTLPLESSNVAIESEVN